MTATITEVEVHDVRFPTSEHRDGSDAMNPDPDYCAAYVVLRTDDPGGPAGHGLCFTIGRGNEVAAAAIRALRPHVTGRTVAEVTGDLGAFHRRLTGSSSTSRTCTNTSPIPWWWTTAATGRRARPASPPAWSPRPSPPTATPTVRCGPHVRRPSDDQHAPCRPAVPTTRDNRARRPVRAHRVRRAVRAHRVR